MSCLWEVLKARCSYVRSTRKRNSRERLSEFDRLSTRKTYWFSTLNRYESQLLNKLTNRYEAICESNHWVNWRMNTWTNKKVMLYFASVLIIYDSEDSKRLHNIKIVSTAIELNRCSSKNWRIVENTHTSQICLRLRIFTLFESKSKHQVSLTRRSINEKARAWEIARNTHSNRTCICLNISELFCIEVTSQSTISWSRISTSKQFLQQANWIKIQARVEELWEMFIQIRSVFVFVSQHSSLIKNLVHAHHASKMTSQPSQSERAWRNIWDTHTNQACVCSWIFAFFVRRQKSYQSKWRDEMQTAQLTEQWSQHQANKWIECEMIEDFVIRDIESFVIQIRSRLRNWSSHHQADERTKCETSCRRYQTL